MLLLAAACCCALPLPGQKWGLHQMYMQAFTTLHIKSTCPRQAQTIVHSSCHPCRSSNRRVAEGVGAAGVQGGVGVNVHAGSMLLCSQLCMLYTVLSCAPACCTGGEPFLPHRPCQA